MYDALAAYSQKLIRKAIKARPERANDPAWVITPTQRSYDIPKKLINQLMGIYNDKDKLGKFKKLKPREYPDLMVLGATLAGMGNASPTAAVSNKGLLSGIYQPSVFLANDLAKAQFLEFFALDDDDYQLELIVQFGDSIVPISWDSEVGTWVSWPIDGLTQFHVDFKPVTIKGRGGSYDIVDVTFALEGSRKPSKQFKGKLGTIRDEKTNRDVVKAEEMIEILYDEDRAANPDAWLEEIGEFLKPLPSGGGYVNTFEDEQFPVAHRYPIVGLKVEERTGNDGNTWPNYIVKCKTGTGEKLFRLPPGDKAMFNEFANFYPVEDPDNLWEGSDVVLTTEDESEIEDMFDDDFTVDEVENYTFSIDFIHRETTLTKPKGGGVKKNITVHLHPHVDLEGESRIYRQLTPAELNDLIVRYDIEVSAADNLEAAADRVRKRVEAGKDVDYVPPFAAQSASAGSDADEYEQAADSAYAESDEAEANEEEVEVPDTAEPAEAIADEPETDEVVEETVDEADESDEEEEPEEEPAPKKTVKRRTATTKRKTVAAS